ncbi:MAG: hypothetical protein HKN16_12800, partial [Saprospiraceae bacterium]|nr:hypothetical protein [Saprospiraceae bacterium]
MMLRLLPLFILLLSSLGTFSQGSLDSFSLNRVTYMGELETFMNASNQKGPETAFEAFAPKASLLNDQQFERVITLSNQMLQGRLGAKGYFTPYLTSLSSLLSKTEFLEPFDQWHTQLEGLFAQVKNRKFKDFRNFLVFSQSFFEGGKIKDGGASLSWLAEAGDYDFDWKNERPTIKFKEFRLTAVRKKDSISIEKTAGVLDVLEKTFTGEGGTVNWDRSKGSSGDVTATLGAYEVDLTKPFYRVSDATLTYPELFPTQKLKGSFEDKILVGSSSSSSYPRFESSESRLHVKNIGENVEYTGGFRLQGKTVYGFGTADNPANVTIKRRSGTDEFKAEAELFKILKGERVTAEGAHAVVYFDQDSIYHPSVNIKYQIQDKDLTMNRGERGKDRNPFFDSYHNLNINVNSLKLRVGMDSLIIGGKAISFTSANREVVFESLHFFSENDYERLQNISSTNPLIVIRAVSTQHGSNFVNAEDIAPKFGAGFDASSIQSLLYDLVAQGFINYDSDTKMVEILEKVYHYTDAKARKTDFDNLKITSKTKDTNAIFNLKTKDILSDGISVIEFSQSQKVALKPFAEQVLFQENRNMEFDGKLFAGFTIYEGRDFHFDYEKNQIEMDSIRFFDMYVPTEAVDDKGNPIATSINSRLENANGVLLIDAPNNKAGQEDIPVFPSFQSKENSYVFYDDPSTLNGVYSR